MSFKAGGAIPGTWHGRAKSRMDIGGIRRMMTRGFTPEARAAWSPLRDGDLPREFLDGHPWLVLDGPARDALAGARTLHLAVNTVTDRSGIGCTGPGGNAFLPAPGRIRSHGEDRGEPVPHFGSELLHQWGVASEVSTVTGSLRPGDGIRLSWFPDGLTTGPLRDAGFHHDMVRLEVRRGDRLLVHRLSDRVTDTRTLRIVRPFDPAEEPFLAKPRGGEGEPGGCSP